MTTTDRMTEIQAIYRRFADVYQIGGGLTLVLVGVWIGSLLFGDGYATNVYTEMLSIFVTILVLDRLSEWRSTQRRKQTLVREASSRDNSTALNAVDWLRNEGWLTVEDETPLLVQTKLSRADLHHAYLNGANLQNTNCYKANLSFADLSGANIRNAFFYRTNLNHSYVYLTDFRQTVLSGANLSNAHYIDKAIFDEHTVLPDGEPLLDENGNNILNDAGHFVYDKYWKPDTDMTRYTDPTHPDFWQPDWTQEHESIP